MTRLHSYPLLLAMILVALGCASAQQRPLITEDVDIIPPGSLRIEGGLDSCREAKYPVSGINGDLTRVGVIRCHYWNVTKC
jgi:hypothetical protein